MQMHITVFYVGRGDGGGNSVRIVCLHSEKGPTLKGKNVQPMYIKKTIAVNYSIDLSRYKTKQILYIYLYLNQLFIIFYFHYYYFSDHHIPLTDDIFKILLHKLSYNVQINMQEQTI